jgi:hypothetical protein
VKIMQIVIMRIFGVPPNVLDLVLSFVSGHFDIEGSQRLPSISKSLFSFQFILFFKLDNILHK